MLGLEKSIHSMLVTRSKTRGTKHQLILILNKYENKNIIVSRNRPSAYQCACLLHVTCQKTFDYFTFSVKHRVFSGDVIITFQQLNKLTLKIIFVLFPDVVHQKIFEGLFTCDP